MITNETTEERPLFRWGETSRVTVDEKVNRYTPVRNELTSLVERTNLFTLGRPHAETRRSPQATTIPGTANRGTTKEDVRKSTIDLREPTDYKHRWLETNCTLTVQ
ncbi:expressed unknown protein [Seminavis robusta]|uniref:Uncharacterized protein n=1 Tax=Seminavis robusta TaxID=568900 RepID=A0A9N8H6H1_9STRA|nr:expressed unknown protein [Seminavis robusta]|eukprot:Sro146_g067661.1  (106) ;mRNA; r:83224-83541